MVSLFAATDVNGVSKIAICYNEDGMSKPDLMPEEIRVVILALEMLSNARYVRVTSPDSTPATPRQCGYAIDENQRFAARQALEYFRNELSEATDAANHPVLTAIDCPPTIQTAADLATALDITARQVPAFDSVTCVHGRKLTEDCLRCMPNGKEN